MASGRNDTHSISLTNIDYGNPRVWDLICTGKTLGVFQLEAGWLHDWVRKIKPRNLWDLSSVIAIVRPGAFGFAETYINIRNGKQERYDFGHPVINEILSNTDGILLYQESLILLGQRLAWPHLQELPRLIKADELRKAVGKKDQEKILKIGKEFVEGCLHNKVPQEIADTLFGIIRDCGRYLFNLSHSMLYAYVAYQTAYFKTYYPKQFYATYLTYATERLDKFGEIKNLINDARSFGIDVLPPNINKNNPNFKIEGDAIRYGLCHIKCVSSAHADWLKTIKITSLGDYVKLCIDGIPGKVITKTVIQALAGSGAFSDLKIPRQVLIAVSEFINKLTDKEVLSIKTENIKSPNDIFNMVKTAKLTSKRREKLDTIITLFPQDTEENVSFVDAEEKRLLGIPLSLSLEDGKKHSATDRCIDLLGNHELWTVKTVAAVIEEIRLTTTKRGKNPGQEMCFISIRDSSGAIKDIPVFPKTYEAFKHSIIPNTVVELEFKYGRSNSWSVESVHELLS